MGGRERGPADGLRPQRLRGPQRTSRGTGPGGPGGGGWSDLTDRKRYFAFAYLSLGGNLDLVALTAALCPGPTKTRVARWVALPLLLATCAGLVWYARRSQTYLFLLMGAVFGYIGVTYLLFEALDSELGLILGTLYFPLSAISLVLLLINVKRALNISPKS